MARSLNKVQLIGRLGRDPELKHTQNGTSYCRFSIATDEEWTDKNTQEKQSRTEWHNCVAWQRLAEICAQYLEKGRLVYVEGQIQSRQWEDQDGNKRTSYDIRIRDMVMLGGGRQESGGSGGGNPSGGRAEISDDDIPF